LKQTTRLAGFEPKQATCDLGYRGHSYIGNCDIQIVNRFRKRLPESMRHWWRRRSAIEPVIGHAKEDNRLSRNRLKGIEGDQLNAIFAGYGYNIRKMLRAFALSCALIAERYFKVLKEVLKRESVRGNNFPSKSFFFS
jgi:IS5 family transposase